MVNKAKSSKIEVLEKAAGERETAGESKVCDVHGHDMQTLQHVNTTHLLHFFNCRPLQHLQLLAVQLEVSHQVSRPQAENPLRNLCIRPEAACSGTFLH